MNSTSITVRELIAHLSTFPPDAEVWLADPNYTGHDLGGDLCEGDIWLENDLVLINFPVRDSAA